MLLEKPSFDLSRSKGLIGVQNQVATMIGFSIIAYAPNHKLFLNK